MTPVHVVQWCCQWCGSVSYLGRALKLTISRIVRTRFRQGLAYTDAYTHVSLAVTHSLNTLAYTTHDPPTRYSFTHPHSLTHHPNLLLNPPLSMVCFVRLDNHSQSRRHVNQVSHQRITTITIVTCLVQQIQPLLVLSR